MSFIQPTTLHLCVCENVVPRVDGNDHEENDCLKHKKYGGSLSSNQPMC